MSACSLPAGEGFWPCYAQPHPHPIHIHPIHYQWFEIKHSTRVAGRDERRRRRCPAWPGVAVCRGTGFETLLQHREWRPRRAQVPGPPAFHSGRSAGVFPACNPGWHFASGRTYSPATRLFAYAGRRDEDLGRGSGTGTPNCDCGGAAVCTTHFWSIK